MDHKNDNLIFLIDWFSEYLKSLFCMRKQTFAALKTCYIYTLSKF